MNHVEILAHRGFWSLENEKNSIFALKRALVSGYGVELDLRDHNNNLVISHDPATGENTLFDEFLQLYNQIGATQTIAINIKSDGISDALCKALKRYNIQNYFAFDMSIPDTLSYLKNNILIYMRISEYEDWTPLHEKAAGIWLDNFTNKISYLDLIKKITNNSKPVCMVSPELHGRPPLEENIAKLILDRASHICTDEIGYWSNFE